MSSSRDTVVARKPGDIFEVFICSEAGKPIYCFRKDRDEEFVVTLMGVCQALINFFIDSEKDLLKCIITASGLKVTFAIKTPLIIVVVTHILSPVDAQLVTTQVYAQIVSILTKKTLKSVFEQRPTFDLRRLLGSSEKLIDTVVQEGILGPVYIIKRTVARSSHDLLPACGIWFSVFSVSTVTNAIQFKSRPNKSELKNDLATSALRRTSSGSCDATDSQYSGFCHEHN
ncbi:Vacuolar fusion protein MON1 -like protein A [Halotydeus destructor]|nr:Vacuolar fusion protein MON1 -like protein A [Halotydeus destructor]